MLPIAAPIAVCPLSLHHTSLMQSPGHVLGLRAQLGHPGPAGTQSSLSPITSFSLWKGI